MTVQGAIAVTRFGLGAQPGEIDRASEKPKAWLLAQLKVEPASHPAFKNLASSAQAYLVAERYRQNRKGVLGPALEAVTASHAKTVREIFNAELKARSIYAAQTDAPFHERLTRFWSNHFSISARSRNIRLLSGAYEREAIRPHITGRFYDLAVQAIFHPAMLVYLDNVSSTGPASRRGLKRRRGLNENLAREVMELHTVTPAARYDQSDVTEFAKALTGWTIARSRDAQKIAGITVFKNSLHEPGRRSVLGQSYGGKGKSQARDILKSLCQRPETAQNIAVKLAQHFVSDTPPDALAKSLKDTFLKTDGDLTALYKTLIKSSETWREPAEKVKTPEELFISTARMVGLKNVFPKRVNDSYDNLAQRPFTAPTPAGWPDKAEAWLGPNALSKRIEWASELSARLQGVDARDFLRAALGARLSAGTLKSVSRAESPQQAMVLALMSPEFQRR